MVATYGGYLWWLPMVATFEKSVPAPLLIYCDWFQTISRGASNVFDCGKNLWIPGAAPWSPHGVPPGGYLWKSVPAPLLIYSDWFQTISRGASIVFNCSKNLWTPGGYLWKIGSGVPAYFLWQTRLPMPALYVLHTSDGNRTFFLGCVVLYGGRSQSYIYQVL